MKKKGQVAIEFLTTYSWAIMIVLLTIGALVYFDLFNTTRFIAERCETGSQIQCVEAAATEGGEFRIRLLNNFPVDIEIVSIQANNAGIISVEQILPRSSIETFSVNVGPGLSKNTKESFDVIITFKRAGGTKEYEIRGNAVVRPLPAGLI